MMNLLQRHRHHYFAESECVMDEWEDGFTVTAQQDDVKVGDTVKVFHHPGVVFTITQVDYYSNPSDMFIAHIYPVMP
jgi:CTP synthase (UTP-ammonia lyase)